MSWGFWICAFHRLKRSEANLHMHCSQWVPLQRHVQISNVKQTPMCVCVCVALKATLHAGRLPHCSAAAVPVPECSHDALSRILGEISSHHKFASTPTVPPWCSIFIDCLHSQSARWLFANGCKAWWRAVLKCIAPFDLLLSSLNMLFLTERVEGPFC